MANKSLIEKLKQEHSYIKGEESLLSVVLYFLNNPKDIINFYNEFIDLQKKPKNGISPKQSAELKIMCYLSPYSGYYKSSDKVHRTNRQKWVKALHDKILFEPVAQKQTEIYCCPICTKEFEQTFAQAKRRISILEKVRKHVKIPLGNPIPKGIAFKEKGIYYFIEYEGEITPNHGYKQQCGIYRPERNPLGARFYDIIYDRGANLRYVREEGRVPLINSKEIKQRLKEGKARFLTLEETKKLSRDYHQNSKYSSFFKIRTLTKQLKTEILSTP